MRTVKAIFCILFPLCYPNAVLRPDASVVFWRTSLELALLYSNSMEGFDPHPGGRIVHFLDDFLSSQCLEPARTRLAMPFGRS